MSIRLFVSYSHNHRDWCRRFAERLIQDAFDVFFDEFDIAPSTSFVQAIGTNLEQCDIYIIILTPEVSQSEWIQRELDIAVASHKTIIPVLYKPVATLPPYLRPIHYVTALDQPPDVAAVLTEPYLKPSQKTMIAPVPPPGTFPEYLLNLNYHARVVNGYWFFLPPLCPIVAGTYLIGNNITDDSESFANEQPANSVQITDIEMMQYPVTVAEYACAVRVRDVKPPRELGSMSWREQTEHAAHPVVCVTWQQAREYAAWLSQLTGERWRLPTEAEWEIAARWDPAASKNRRYPWGDAFDKNRANTIEGGRQSLAPVGTYDAAGKSAIGVSDMVGNVWEWCSTAYHAYPYRTMYENETTGPTNRVVKGGSYLDTARQSRPAARNFEEQQSFFSHRGFRLVKDV